MDVTLRVTKLQGVLFLHIIPSERAHRKTIDLAQSLRTVVVSSEMDVTLRVTKLQGVLLLLIIPSERAPRKTIDLARA